MFEFNTQFNNPANNNPLSNFNQETSQKKELILKIFLIILIVIVMTALIVIMTTKISERVKERNNSSALNEGSENEDNAPLPGTLTEKEEKYLNCLQTDNFDNECALAFSDPEIDMNPFCNKLSINLKDKCFYTYATSNYNQAACELISNSELKNSCRNSAIRIIPEMPPA